MDSMKLDLPTQLPDHTQLPCEDGNFVLAKRTVGQNFHQVLIAQIESLYKEKIGRNNP